VDSHTLHQKYLRQGTPGFAVIRRFYSRYSDILVKVNLVDINDVVHEVFVSLSRTDFKQVQNVDHYTMRAIKLQCWSLLDKAMRSKAHGIERRANIDEADEAAPHKLQPDHVADLDGMELLAQVNLFKAQLPPRDVTLLNMLVDGAERSNIAKFLGLNVNTLDTNIRRLRIRLADFLKDLGYTYQAIEKFGS